MPATIYALKPIAIQPFDNRRARAVKTQFNRILTLVQNAPPGRYHKAGKNFDVFEDYLHDNPKEGTLQKMVQVGEQFPPKPIPGRTSTDELSVYNGLISKKYVISVDNGYLTKGYSIEFEVHDLLRGVSKSTKFKLPDDYDHCGDLKMETTIHRIPKPKLFPSSSPPTSEKPLSIWEKKITTVVQPDGSTNTSRTEMEFLYPNLNS